MAQAWPGGSAESGAASAASVAPGVRELCHRSLPSAIIVSAAESIPLCFIFAKISTPTPTTTHDSTPEVTR